MILSICSDPRVLSKIRLVKIVITIIKIVVPLILIIAGMIGFVRATMQGEVNDTLKSLIRKVIAAILIFLIRRIRLKRVWKFFLRCFMKAIIII